MTSLLKTVGKSGPPRKQTNDILFQRLYKLSGNVILIVITVDVLGNKNLQKMYLKHRFQCQMKHIDRNTLPRAQFVS